MRPAFIAKFRNKSAFLRYVEGIAVPGAHPFVVVQEVVEGAGRCWANAATSSDGGARD